LTQSKKQTLKKKMAGSNVVAIDTEMVLCEISETQTDFVAGQVSVVTLDGKILVNTYMKPSFAIKDYNTAFSGITEEKLNSAPPLEEVRKLVLSVIRDKVLVGHAVNNDLRSLGIVHPPHLIIDIQRIPMIQHLLHKPQPKLKLVSKVLLRRDIQNGSHCSLEDAKATADIFSYALRFGWVGACR
jgi:RNA exonuclease 4